MKYLRYKISSSEGTAYLPGLIDAFVHFRSTVMIDSKFSNMANNADPDQTALRGAV